MPTLKFNSKLFFYLSDGLYTLNGWDYVVIKSDEVKLKMERVKLIDKAQMI